MYNKSYAKYIINHMPGRITQSSSGLVEMFGATLVGITYTLNTGILRHCTIETRQSSTSIILNYSKIVDSQFFQGHDMWDRSILGTGEGISPSLNCPFCLCLFIAFLFIVNRFGTADLGQNSNFFLQAKIRKILDCFNQRFVKAT